MGQYLLDHQDCRHTRIAARLIIDRAKGRTRSGECKEVRPLATTTTVLTMERAPAVLLNFTLPASL